MRSLMRTNTPSFDQIIGLQVVNRIKELAVDIEVKREILSKHIEMVDTICNEDDENYELDELRDFSALLLESYHDCKQILKDIYQIQGEFAYEDGEKLQASYNKLTDKVQRFELSFFEIETDARHFDTTVSVPQLNFTLDQSLVTRIAI